ncbi:MAG TPA: hypothetical protein EYH12_06375 [Psychromonas hadalis]|nr:hypothetical protein [Psychromonas hadalis]
MTIFIPTGSSPLKSINLDISVQLPIVTSTLSQTFINNETESLEAVYQFPLPRDVGFVRLSVLLNDSLHVGKIVSKSSASEQYESAISEENSAILLEQLHNGLYQLSAGNLAPNDTLTITLELASLFNLKMKMKIYATACQR